MLQGGCSAVTKLCDPCAGAPNSGAYVCAGMIHTPVLSLEYTHAFVMQKHITHTHTHTYTHIHTHTHTRTHARTH